MRKTLLTLTLIFSSVMLFAQPTPDGRPTTGVGDNADTTAPLGTSTTLLLVLGGGYLVCRRKKKR